MPPISIVDIAKVLLLGCGGAVAYYFFVSYVFQLAIYPAYRKAADFLFHESIKPESRKKAARYLNLLRAFRGALSVLMGLTWWIMFVGYLYVLYCLLGYYFTFEHPTFWWFVVCAALLPGLWALRQFIGFFKREYSPISTTWKTDHRPLFDQMLED